MHEVTGLPRILHWDSETFVFRIRNLHDHC